MIASRPLRVRCGIGLPHCLQKAVAKLLACGRSKRVTDPSPRSQRTADAFTITSQEWAVPVAFRQREQWQLRKWSKGPSTSNTTSPQMQLPRYAAILTSLINRRALVAALAFPVTSASAPLRHADYIERCPLSGVTRKTFAHTEF